MKKILIAIFCLINLLNINAQLSITVGNAGFASGNMSSSPINIYYRSHHCQILYTQAELLAAGWNGQGTISKLGFNIFGTTAEALPNYSVKLKNTTSTDVSTYDNSGLTTVYSAASYWPSAGGFDMLNLSSNFLWDGTSNLLVDVCFDQVSTYTLTGEVYMYNYTSGNSEYQYVRDDNAPQCSISTDQLVSGSKPQIKFEMTSPTPCSGTPNSGVAISDKVLVCPNTSFNLSLSNGSVENSINFQWQSSPDGSIWSNLGTPQTNWDYSVSSITDTTYYRCVSTCSNSVLSNTSMPIVVNYNPLINCYCLPSYALICANGDNFLDFSISNVVFQPSNCDLNGFSDSTSSAYTVINLTAGTTYSLQANIANSTNGGNMAAGAWIDYDQNGQFDNYEFTYLGNGGGQIYTSNLTVPITAPTGSVRMRLKLDANNATSSTILDPCDNNNFSTFGQILDYRVNITAAPACSGTPNAGLTVSTATAVCPSNSFTLNLSGNSVSSDILYQWQYSLNGTSWLNLGAQQNTIPFTVNTQSITTFYRCVTTCTNGGLSDSSDSVLVNQNLPTACYCTPATVNCANTFISNVLFETISDNPICDGITGYTFNSANTATVNANQSYTISNTYATQSTAYIGAWIDYNQDGTFDSFEYTDLGNGSSGTLTGTINIPFTALAGNTRIRIKTEGAFGDAPILNPCSASNFEGQTLDYPIFINAVSSCSGTPNAGNATTTYSAICENRPFTLDLINNDIVSNMSYQWQSSIDNSTWTNLGASQTFVPYSISSQSVTSYYRCLVTCSSSSLTSPSTTWTITQNPVTTCYCIPEPTDCTGSDVINYVAFATMTNTSTCDGTNGYSDYTSTVASATVSAGQSYTLTTVLGSMFSQHTYAWIDYDQNGIFDSSEYTDLGSNSGNDTISNTINIPVTATPGTTRMRVRDFTGWNLNGADACNSPSGGLKSQSVLTGGANGETEDYFVTILPPDCGIINLPPTIPVTGSTNICLGNSTALDFSSIIPLATGLSYQWKESTGGSYTNVGPNATSFTTTPTVNTSYYCEVVCNGSTIRNTDTVHVNVTSLSISPVVTNSVCNGACNGSITLNATSSSSIIYSWQPALTSTTDIASGLCAGSYTATITDGQSACLITNTFVITQPSPFSVSIAGTNSVMCEQLEDTLKSTITGGLAPLSYNWINLPSATVSTNADYTYTTSIGSFGYGLSVTDANNCIANSNTISITVNPSSNLSGTVTVFPNTSTPVPGYVTLFKYEPFFVRFDSITTQNIGTAGDYNFVSFTSGIYIIKAVPSATNMQVAYGDTAVNWKTAKQINHGCAVNDIQNIQVKSLANFTPGPGTLTGVITETVGYQDQQRIFGNSSNTSYYRPTVPGTPIGGIVVKGGKNPGGQMFVQTTTGPEGSSTAGQYTITGLPYGDYFILVDIPGLDTNNTYHVKISPTDTVFNNLDFTVDSIQINPINPTDVGVHEINTIESKIKIYPNPASNFVTIQYNLQSSSLVKIELLDILGKSVKTLLPSTQQPKDAYKTSWQLEDLKSGLYFIKMNINGTESTSKLSVTN